MLEALFTSSDDPLMIEYTGRDYCAVALDEKRRSALMLLPVSPELDESLGAYRLVELCKPGGFLWDAAEAIRYELHFPLFKAVAC